MAPALEKRKNASSLVSRNVTVSGHRTSVRLEPDMWNGLGEICRRERASLHDICTAIATRRQDGSSLTAAIRVFIMNYYRLATTEDGHVRAGHGRGVIAILPAINGAPSLERAPASAMPSPTSQQPIVPGSDKIQPMNGSL
jgi:predicted DNA-binding ribbon-helix-helix protein